MSKFKKLTRKEFLKNALLGSLGLVLCSIKSKAFFNTGAFWKKPAASGGWTGTISTNQQELNLRIWALANGWNGTSAATITVGAGVYIWSDNTATPALTINGSWPGGITLVNNGYIMGKGGKGGDTGLSGLSGGAALSLGVNVTLNCVGYIAGGGGGGGAGSDGAVCTGGGGAGGGAGGNTPNYGAPYVALSGGAGGGPGSAGTNGNTVVDSGILAYGTGGGGGRIIPGSAGAGGSGGSVSSNTRGGGGQSGGGGGAFCEGTFGGANAGNGGSSNSGGANGANNGVVGDAAGGGGGWGAAGGTGTYAGGAGGKAVALNGNTVTWLGGYPTRVFGAVS